jgi:CHASE3 domain sensor protein
LALNRMATTHSSWTSAKSCLIPKVKAVLALPVAVLLVIAFLSFRSVSRFTHDAGAVAHTHEVLTHLAGAESSLKDLDGGTRNFVLTGDNACLEPYQAAQNNLHQELQAVARLTVDNSGQQRRLAALVPLIENLLAITGGTIAERKTGDRESALVRIQTGGGEAARYRLCNAIQEMQDVERLLLDQRRGEAQRSGLMTQGIIVLAIVCAVALVTLASMAIHRDIANRHRTEQEREIIITQLREALATVKTLNGLLPICAWCKNIRDDKGYWKQLEEYIRDRTEADFTHGICPDCQENQERELRAETPSGGRDSGGRDSLRLRFGEAQS